MSLDPGLKEESHMQPEDPVLHREMDTEALADS